MSLWVAFAIAITAITSTCEAKRFSTSVPVGDDKGIGLLEVQEVAQSPVDTSSIFAVIEKARKEETVKGAWQAILLKHKRLMEDKVPQEEDDDEEEDEEENWPRLASSLKTVAELDPEATVVCLDGLVSTIKSDHVSRAEFLLKIQSMAAELVPLASKLSASTIVSCPRPSQIVAAVESLMNANDAIVFKALLQVGGFDFEEDIQDEEAIEEDEFLETIKDELERNKAPVGEMSEWMKRQLKSLATERDSSTKNMVNFKNGLPDSLKPGMILPAAQIVVKLSKMSTTK